MTAPLSGPVDLLGQTAVVTGAAGGIGRATCASLAREGADVLATDVDADGLGTARELVEGRGQRCETVTCDVSDPAAIEDLRDRTLEVFDEVDVLVAAHGIVSRIPLAEMTVEDWDDVLDVNLRGTALVVQAFQDGMRERGYGKVVCLGSIAGKTGGVISGPNYSASKGGVHAFVKWLAADAAADGVYVNAIAPGPVVTAMTRDEAYTPDISPLSRLGQPEDIAEAVVFLASAQSNWVTGTVLDVNGGILRD